MAPVSDIKMTLTILLTGAVVAATPALGTEHSLVLQDARGDTGDFGCQPAIDLLTMTATWGQEGVVLEYVFRDLSNVTSPLAMVQDIPGGCFWSYTDFVADFGSGPVEDSVVIDHTAAPIFVTGWRAHLYDQGDELPINVEENTIRVTIPYDSIGEPTPGSRIGDFIIEVNTKSGVYSPADQLADQDLVPNQRAPCECWLVYPGA